MPSGGEIGYAYDWLRQRRRKADEQKKKSKKLKEKIKKLAKARKRSDAGNVSRQVE